RWGGPPFLNASAGPRSSGSVGDVTVCLPAGSITSRSTGILAASPTPPPTAQVATFRKRLRSGSSAMRARYQDRAAASAHRALFPLLILFALDTERRLGARLEALLPDRLLADLADAERVVLDLLQREIELRREALLAAAQTEL